MPQLFSLAHPSLLALPPPELIAVAAGAGYGAVGLRLLPSVPGRVAWPLMDDPDGQVLAGACFFSRSTRPASVASSAPWSSRNFFSSANARAGSVKSPVAT